MANLQSLNIDGDTLTLPVGSTAQRPSSPQSGQIRLNNDFTPPVLEIYDGSGWKTFNGRYEAGVGLSSNSPADHPDDILDAYPEASSGLYWINVQGTARQIWMDTEHHRGYMLAARFNASSGDWQADNNRWTSSNTTNATSNPDTNATIKTWAWDWGGFNGALKVRWCLGFKHNYLEEYWHNTNGLRGCFADTPYVQTNANYNTPRGTRHSRQDFIEWFNRSINISNTQRGDYRGRAYQNGNGASWDNCNMRGVNMRPNSGGQRLRYGITLNNEGDCSSNDYEWGMGMTGGRAGSYSCGTRANYNSGPYWTRYITGWCYVK